MFPVQADRLPEALSSTAICNVNPDGLWDCAELHMTNEAAGSQFVNAVFLLISIVAAVIIRRPYHNLLPVWRPRLYRWRQALSPYLFHQTKKANKPDLKPASLPLVFKDVCLFRINYAA